MNQHDTQTIIINATLQLKKEFEQICYQYNVKLTKPLIVIDKLSNSFGKWDPDRKTIFISEELVFNYSWDKVISVLKHEMAHQIVSQIYLSDDSHGEYFLKACKHIGLESIYKKASLSLEKEFPDWRHSPFPDEENNIMRKVEKLLNLSNSTNEHEAYLAMEKVCQITKKYNLDRLFKNVQLQNVSLTINLKVKKLPSSIFYISEILQDHYFISVVFSKIYSAQSNEEFRSIVVMGEKHNVLMAEYVFEYLKRQIDSLWKIYKKSQKLRSKYKASYQKGILKGFSEKLNSLKNKHFNSSISQEKALIKTYQNELFQYVKSQFPKTSSIHQSGLIYKDHYEKGSQEGKQINISRPITQHKSGGNIKLLSTGTDRT